jgi:hypothetical protein
MVMIRTSGMILIPLFLFFITGCATLGPDFSSPEVPVATHWADVDPELLANQPADDPDLPVLTGPVFQLV